MSEANDRVLRLEEIPWPRVAARDRGRTAVFLPSGPGAAGTAALLGPQCRLRPLLGAASRGARPVTDE